MSSFLQLAFLLSIILTAAKLGGYLAMRAGQPSVLGLARRARVQPPLSTVFSLGLGRNRGAVFDPALGKDALSLPQAVIEI